jgi:RNA polymerase sigma factor (sigma-70 family)
MANGQIRADLGQLCRIIGRRSGCTLTDAQLLENFVAQRDEASFEVLVWRHGTMVFNLCRRVLHDAHDAEDAFQAAFLVFARKAGSIGRGESVGSWLYKVAYRIALRLRSRTAKRSGFQEPADDLPAPESADEVDWRDLRPILDEEIDRLPEKYRTPFVLCYLEGHTNEEAAEQLGCPKGTILSRLARGRERLRGRLARRGLALSAAWLTTSLFSNASAAATPAVIVNSTVAAAIPFAAGHAAAGLVSSTVAALTQGALRTMFLTKLKFAATALMALAVLGTGIGVVSYRTMAATTDKVRSVDTPRTVAPNFTHDPSESVVFAQERGGEREARQRPDFMGILAAVSADGKTLTYIGGVRGEEEKKVDITINDKTKIEWQGPLADPNNKFKAGDFVSVWFAEGSKNVAARIEAQRGASLGGRVEALSNDGKTITVEGFTNRGEEPKKVDVKLTDKSTITFVGAAKELGGKLKAGDVVSVWLQEGSPETVVALQVQRGPDVRGKIIEISADGKELTVEAFGRGRGEVKRTPIKLTDRTKIGSGRGGELKPIVNFQVEVWLEEGSQDTAALIQVNQPRSDAVGAITAISPDGKTLTVESRSRGGESTKSQIHVTPETKLEFHGGQAKEKKLKVGYTVAVWFKEGSTDTAALVLANVQRRAPDIQATISAVAADGKSITLEIRKRGEDTATSIEIKLTPQTEVEFAGTDKTEDQKLTIGYTAAVWFQDGSKDTAAVIVATKRPERSR